MNASETVALALGSALFGALAAGGVRVALSIWDRRTRKRVAARAVMGDIAVAEAAFGLLIERQEWFDHDFGLALSTWTEYRGDFIGAVSLADWAQVDSFYSNLARAAEIARPGRAARDGDVAVAESQIEYAAEAWKVVKEHIGGTEAERDEIVSRLGKDI